MKIYTLLSFLVIGIISFGQEPILEITQEGEDFNFVLIFSELNPVENFLFPQTNQVL